MAQSKIAEREPQHPRSGNFIRDIVFGANDGVVTAIGFVIGIAASIAHREIIVVAGVLEVVAGAASMALGNYLAVKSQREYYEAMERIEKWEMKNKPEVERDEIREIYTDMGFEKDQVELLTKKVTSDDAMWLDVMMREELGLTKQEAGNPIMSGIIIGFFFLVGGMLVILPYIFVSPLTSALIASFIVGILVLVGIAVIRWFLNKGSLGQKVAETVIIGVVAALIGYVAGLVLKLFGFNITL